VLIVDDEPGIRFALRRWFERQHWDVVEASDGGGALAALRDPDAGTGFDVIVCDLHLPVRSGDQIVQLLRTEQPALASRVLLTTGDAVADADPGSVLHTHPHVLQKPFDLATLRAAIERIAGG
jgi:DNA-binding response OmpR family regulator